MARSPTIVAAGVAMLAAAATAPVTDPAAGDTAELKKGKAEPRLVAVKILSPVHHDGEEIEVGAELELPFAQAEALVLAGAAGQPDD